MRKVATSRISTIIKNNVKNGIWKVGKPIPSATKIAATYGASIKTVRNALSSLLGLTLDIRGTKIFAINNKAYWDLQSEKKNSLSQIKVSYFMLSGGMLDKTTQYLIRNDGSTIFIYNQFIDKEEHFNKINIIRSLKHPVFFEDVTKDKTLASEYNIQAGIRVYLDVIIRNKKQLDIGV